MSSVDQLSAALAAGADCRFALVDALLEEGRPLEAEAVRQLGVPLLPSPYIRVRFTFDPAAGPSWTAYRIEWQEFHA